jgi:hypothetical protein
MKRLEDIPALFRPHAREKQTVKNCCRLGMAVERRTEAAISATSSAYGEATFNN